MSISIKRISLEEDNDYITLSELMCKGIFDQKLPISKFFKDYELGDEISKKNTLILKNLNDNLKIDSSDYNFLINLLVSLLYKLKSNIVELVERISIADQALTYRDMILKEKDEKQFLQIKFFVDKIKRLEEDNKNIKQKDKEINKLSSSISSLSLKNIEHEENAEEFNKKIKNLQTEINSTKSKFQKEINDLKNEVSKQCGIVEKQQKIIDSNKGLENKYKVLEKTLKEKTDSENSFKGLKFDFEELQKLKHTSDKEMKNLLGKNKSLELQIREFKDINSQSIIQIDNLNKIIEEKDITIKKTIDTNKINEKLIQDKISLITELEKQLDSMKKDFNQLEQTCQNDKKIIQDLKKKLENMKSKEVAYIPKNKHNKKFINHHSNIQHIQQIQNVEEVHHVPNVNYIQHMEHTQNMRYMQHLSHMQHIQNICNVQMHHINHLQNVQQIPPVEDMGYDPNTCEHSNFMGQNPFICYVPVPVPAIPPFPILPSDPEFNSYYPQNIYHQEDNLEKLEKSNADC